MRPVRRSAGEQPRNSEGLWYTRAPEEVTAAFGVLEELDETLNANRVHLVFAELKDPVRRKIERYELTRTIDPRHFFPTVEAAVAAFRLRAGAQWAPPATASPPPARRARPRYR